MDKIRKMPEVHRRKARKKSGRKRSVRYFDYNLFAVIIFLVCFGLVMLYSSSAYSALVKYGDSMYYFKRQIIFCAAGFVIMYLCSRINYHRYTKWAKPIYGLSIVLMLLVQTPLGKEVNGARRWLRLPFGQQIQPSELAKIAIILLVPLVICQTEKKISSLKDMFMVLRWGVVEAACVYIFTENLSTALIVLGISCVLIFIVHPKTAPFLALAAGGFTLLAVAIRILSSWAHSVEMGEDFRMDRIIVWLAPERYASGGGFQVMQGLYAIGSGGFFGKGLGNSAQKMIIPEVQNDMILSIICEELGVFGAVIVMILFGLLLYRLAFIAQNAPDWYGALIVSGIFAHIALQVILNVAVVINLIPTTGITLPFISYGGTSVLFLMAEMGIALGVSGTIRLND